MKFEGLVIENADGSALIILENSNICFGKVLNQQEISYIVNDEFL
jgi:hypothetical protein